MIGSDDVLACFVAGNTFTWDDWFRLETLDDSLQPTIDMLLNVTIFIWYGAVVPWHEFANNPYISAWRLVVLGFLILLVRRIPIVLALHKHIHQIENFRHAFFVGFFGPIGVSAVFYLAVTREYLATVTNPDGTQRADAAQLAGATLYVVWFLVVCSTVVHGISIPLGKLGVQLPRTISAAISSDRASVATSFDVVGAASLRLRNRSASRVESVLEHLRGAFPSAHKHENPAHAADDRGEGNISAPINGRVLGHAIGARGHETPTPRASTPVGPGTPIAGDARERTLRWGDE